MASLASSYRKNHPEIEIENPHIRPAYPAAAACTSTSTSGVADLNSRNSSAPSTSGAADLSAPSTSGAADLSAPSTSGAADPISGNSYGYTVFLNHHGQDVKNTIASHIYHRLRFYGIEVFLDRPELTKGKEFSRQIRDALSNASVRVAIFSPKYAESKWCLSELLYMLEKNTEIITVFYNVKPHELRQTDGIDGIYAQGLQKLEREMIYDPQNQQEKPRFSPHIISLWREALSEASRIKGFELDAFNG